jgi:hypothetical protein
MTRCMSVSMSSCNNVRLHLERNAYSYLNEVNFGECLIIARFLDVEDGDDVFMIEIPQ